MKEGIKLTENLPGERTRKLLELKEMYEPRSMSDQVPTVWKKARGVYVEDVEGNTFLDFSSGVLVANVGHSHPRLVEVIREQAEKVINCYDFPTEHRLKLAEKLVEITPPNLNKVFLLTTGAETTEAAIKLSRLYTGKYEIVAFYGAFHGRTYGALSVGGKKSGAGSRGFGPFLPGIILAPFPYCYRCPFGKTYPTCKTYCFDFIVDWVLPCESENRIAAFITETYQGGAGSIIPPVEWMKKLESLAKEKKAVLIIDEVQASFGRTGKLFGFEHYGITPNLLCLGKGITSSVPLSALIGESRIMDILTPGSLSSTHGGNPFCSRVALENINIIMEEGLVENSRKGGEFLKNSFQELLSRHNILGDARGMGLVWGLEIVEDKKSKKPSPEKARKVVQEAYKRGLLMIAPIGMFGNVIRVAPPLCIRKEELETGIEIIDSALSEAGKQSA